MERGGPGTRNALFLSSGETISRMFASVIAELDPAHHWALVVNQDFYYGEDSARILAKRRVATRSLREYGTYDARAILRREGPDVLVVGHAGGAVERSFIAASRLLGIPTLLLQDGIIGRPAPLAWRDSVSMIAHMIASLWGRPKAALRYLYAIRAFGFRNFLHAFSSWSRASHEYALERCTKVAVMGPYAKRVFTDLGYADEDVVITGQPRFDALQRPGESREIVYQRLGIDTSQKLLVVAPPIFRIPEQRAAFMRVIARATRAFEELTAVVKVHPREDTGPYARLWQEERANAARFVADFPVPALLQACDLLLSNYSTMTLEALIVGRPVIVLRAPDEVPYYPFVEEGLSATVTDELELENALRELVLEGGPADEGASRRERFVLEHAYARDGRASARVAALIGDLSSASLT